MTHEMSACDVLKAMIRTDRGSMTVWSPAEVRDALAAYRAAVLLEAADAAEQTFIHGVMPAASERDEIWDQAVRAVATMLRGMTDEAQPAKTGCRRCGHRSCMGNGRRCGVVMTSDSGVVDPPCQCTGPAAEAQQPTDADVVEAHDISLSFTLNNAETPQQECTPACSEQHTYKPGCALAVGAQQQPDTETPFATRVLEIFAKADAHGDLLWRIVDGQPEFAANVSDVFAWGGADAEDITAETLPVLEQAFTDLAAIRSTEFVADLYAARLRKMRPQGAAYPGDTHPNWREVSALFDACGPERELGLGNPKPAPAHRAADAAVSGPRAADDKQDGVQAYTPATHYVRDDGVECCVHTIPVGPDSCQQCRDLDQPAAPARTAASDVLAKVVAALQAKAAELSAEAEEEMRRDLEEQAQVWHEPADMVRRVGRKAADRG